MTNSATDNLENLTEEDLLFLHNIVEEKFKVFTGVKDQGLVKAISERPNQILYGKFAPFDDIFTKAASLMEGIIRMHPFYDGNKRTALLAVIAYLELNGYTMVVPLSAVRFTVKIAKTMKNEPDDTAKLIRKIGKWIAKLSAKNEDKRAISWKIILHFILPLIGLMPLTFISFGLLGQFVIGRWMAFDIYPEYKKETGQILSFIADMMKKSIAKEMRSKK